MIIFVLNLRDYDLILMKIKYIEKKTNSACFVFYVSMGRSWACPHITKGPCSNGFHCNSLATQ